MTVDRSMSCGQLRAYVQPHESGPWFGSPCRRMRHRCSWSPVTASRWFIVFFFSSRRRHTRSVSAFLLNRSSDLEGLTKRSAVGFLLRSLIMFQTFISRHNSNFFSDKLVLTSVTPASSAPVLQTPKATSSTLYFDSLTVNAGNGGFLH